MEKKLDRLDEAYKGMVIHEKKCFNTGGMCICGYFRKFISTLLKYIYNRGTIPSPEVWCRYVQYILL